ncbi:MAG: AzlC family ABC transporter permease [Spirochaetales bacterium]|nr:AzlC family ABC transporter permease [Spirochaetales bacterium]
MTVFTIFSNKCFKAAFRCTVPVMLGYLAIGTAFGLLAVNAGYSWLIALLMSIIIYAGAGQYIAVSMFAQNADFAEIALVTLLVNARHMVYGLSLLDKFRSTKPITPYLIFALTDETYSLLTTVTVPDDVNKRDFYFYISMLDHFYWIAGSVIGAWFASIFISFDCTGLSFALTALFMVLLIEQWKQCRSKLPFIIAAIVSVLVLIFISRENMLIFSILISIVVLILLRRRLPS